MDIWIICLIYNKNNSNLVVLIRLRYRDKLLVEIVIFVIFIKLMVKDFFTKNLFFNFANK